MFWSRKNKKNYMKVFKSEDPSQQFALLAVNGKMRDGILTRLRETYRVQGDHILSGGKIADQSLYGLLVGGSGALSYAAFKSGTLFMATANPATLMAIGNGVGSAVMGAGGIVGQAPFIAVSGALMPVLAPLVAFQALQTMMIINQFEAVHRRFDRVEKKLGRILQRTEATSIGETISAGARLDALEAEHSISNIFSSEMVVRLALLEEAVNALLERYRYLYESTELATDIKAEDLRFKQADAVMATTLSILDLRIHILRLKLALQENPGVMMLLSEQLADKLERYERLWKDIQASPVMVDAVVQEMEQAVSDLHWWRRQMPSFVGGRRKKRQEDEAAIRELERQNSYVNVHEMVGDAKEAAAIGRNIKEQLNAQQGMLLYWQDEAGVHSYYTNDVLIK